MEQSTFFDRILAVICSVFDAYSTVLFLQSDEDNSYRLAARFSLGDFVDMNSVVIGGKGIVGRIIDNGQPLLLNNFDQKRGRLEYYLAGGESNIKAFMGCPLKSGAGVICLDSKRTFSFSEKDQKILHLFADLTYDLYLRLATAEKSRIESHFYLSLQHILGLSKRLTRWSAFLENFLVLLGQTSGFDYCFFAARDERGKHFFIEGLNRPIFPGDNTTIRFDLTGGLIGWVFKNNTPVFVGDKDSESASAPLFGGPAQTPAFKSLMLAPLHFSRRTRGVLGFAHEQPQVISEPVKLFAQFAAGHLEMFLENLHLKSQLHALQKRLQESRET